jgi:formyl-CoA transferase
LSKAGVPCGPVLNWKEIIADESLYKCGTLVKVNEPKRGEFITIGCPPKFSNFAPEVTPAPLIGENTDEILSGLGYTADQISKLKAEKVCE